ncbi:MAG: response regulator [Actinobacteria bacterium]|nr:response regulator [Actinomycetota bacterium]
MIQNDPFSMKNSRAQDDADARALRSAGKHRRRKGLELSMSSSIVIASDDPEVANVIVNILGKKDYFMLITNSKLQALWKLLNQELRCLIYDFELESDSNITFINIIKSVRPRLPIIVLSPDNSPEMIKQLTEAGIFYYALKPLIKDEMEQLIDAIDGLVNN